MGLYRGTQTELVRIPFADANCLRLPGEPGDQWEHDFVLLADAFPTGYHATELAQVSKGDSVAIFGAGAIGLLAAYCALHLRGATDVYVVDYIPERLAKAGELGAIPIDFRAGDYRPFVTRDARRFYECATTHPIAVAICLHCCLPYDLSGHYRWTERLPRSDVRRLSQNQQGDLPHHLPLLAQHLRRWLRAWRGERHRHYIRVRPQLGRLCQCRRSHRRRDQ